MLLEIDVQSFIDFIDRISADPYLIWLLLFAFTFINEDIATVSGALLVAEGVIDLPTGYSAINTGIILGDSGLYGLGALAARYRRARALVATRNVYRAKRWIKSRLGPILLSTRFLPGSRVPTYTACGFFGFSFTFFVSVLVVASLAWTAVIFAILVTTGSMILEVLGPWKWAGALGFVALAIFAPRLLGKRLAAKLGVMSPPKK